MSLEAHRQRVPQRVLLALGVPCRQDVPSALRVSRARRTACCAEAFRRADRRLRRARRTWVRLRLRRRVRTVRMRRAAAVRRALRRRGPVHPQRASAAQRDRLKESGFVYTVFAGTEGFLPYVESSSYQLARPQTCHESKQARRTYRESPHANPRPTIASNRSWEKGFSVFSRLSKMMSVEVESSFPILFSQFVLF